MKRRTFIATAGATVASAALAGCGEAGPGADTEAVTDGGTGTDGDGLDLGNVDAEIGDTPENLEVANSRLAETENGAAVIGTVRNTGNQPYEFVEAEVTLNDGDTVVGEWVDTSEQEIDGLGPGETWRFVATFEGEEVNQATGYTIQLDGDLADGGGVGTDDGLDGGDGNESGTDDGTGTDDGVLDTDSGGE